MGGAGPPGRDHPRSRGEHMLNELTYCPRLGSSPLSRGALPESTEEYQFRGIMPALAGSTSSGRSSGLAPWDHPRSRGEHLVAAYSARRSVGSSPLSRGARAEAEQHGGGGGIIPALAGSTPIRRAGRGPARGIIPALAGSTATGHRPHPTAPDHPRSRGEHDRVCRQRHAEVGSSPLSRGAPPQGGGNDRIRRIIPALAGSTNGVLHRLSFFGDHPRSRGEHVQDGVVGSAGGGSSPLSRGARHAAHPHDQAGGIIPALAGSTWLVGQAAMSAADHPRSRGEHQ